MNEPKPCKICQTPFTPRRVTDLTCGNPVCRRKRDAANARAKRLAKKPAVKCRFCGAEFTPNAPTRCSGVCRSENCQIRLRREHEGKRTRKTAPAQAVPGKVQPEKAAPTGAKANFVKRKTAQTAAQRRDAGALERVIRAAYERGDRHERERIAALNPGMF